MDTNTARQTIADMDSGKTIWNDHIRAQANNAIDASDPSKQLKKFQDQQRESHQQAIQPAVESFQAQQPEITAKFGQAREQLTAEQDPLKQRYQNLLDSIKQQGQQDINKQTRITSGELGKRGITGSSTLAQQEIQDATSPLTQKYTGLEKETTLSREDSLRQLRDSIANLTPQETSDQRAITNAIAQLQAGAGQQGLESGMSLYGTNLEQIFRKQQFEEQQKQSGISNALAQLQANQPVGMGEGSSLVDPNTGKIITTLPKTYKDLQNQFGVWE